MSFFDSPVARGVSLLVATFLFGVVVGSVVYLQFPRVDIAEMIPSEASDGEVTVVVHAYGDCRVEGACYSYRVEEGGEYAWTRRSDTEKPQTFEGKLSSSLVRELMRAARDDVPAQSCSPSSSLPGIRYVVTRGTERIMSSYCGGFSEETVLTSVLLRVGEELHALHLSS